MHYFSSALLPNPYLTRMLVPLPEQVRNNPAVVSVLKRVLEHQEVVTPPLQPQMDESAEVVATRLLIRHVILVEDDFDDSHTICFASPLHYRHFCHELYPSQVSPFKVYASIDDFVLAVLKTFEPSDFRRLGNWGTSFVKEGPLQHWFDAGARRILPPHVQVMSEVSKWQSASMTLAEAQGRVDFIIDSSYSFGIELLRGQGNIAEHLARFKTGGKYEALELKSVRVVHFKLAPWAARTSDPNYMAVEVHQDFSGATVHLPNGNSVLVVFEGFRASASL